MGATTWTNPAASPEALGLMLGKVPNMRTWPQPSPGYVGRVQSAVTDPSLVGVTPDPTKDPAALNPFYAYAAPNSMANPPPGSGAPRCTDAAKHAMLTPHDAQVSAPWCRHCHPWARAT